MADFDLAVIGAGPGGQACALRAAQLGARVALVEAAHLGGVCLNVGCIPAKALLATADMITRMQRAADWGIEVHDWSYNLDIIRDRQQRIVERLRAELEALIYDRGVTLIRGRGRLDAANRVAVALPDGEQTLSADKILLATGSSPLAPASCHVDEERVLTSDGAVNLPTVPKDMLVVGSGAVGLEFMRIYHALGSSVTLVDSNTMLNPNGDHAISALLAQRIYAKGIKTRVGVRIQGVIPGKRLTARFSDGSLWEGDGILLAIGRSPNLSGLGLEALGLEMNGRFPKLDEHLETSIPGLFAVGDITGRPALAHVATHQGLALAAHLFDGTPHPINYDTIPFVIYGQPEIASVGLAEWEADRRFNVVTGLFPFRSNPKAVVEGEDEGFIKVVAEQGTGRLLGVHVVGYHASLLIHEAVLALQQGIPAHAVIESMHAHPTMSEAFPEAIAAALDRSITLLTELS